MARLIVGNWKMNLGPEGAVAITRRLQDLMGTTKHVDVVVCPAFIDLVPVKQAIKGDQLVLGAQNAHHLDAGAVTGEVSAAMLAHLVTYVILGHSERRVQFREDDSLIAKKVAAAVRNGLRPILCVGESLTEREHKQTQRIVVSQLMADIVDLTAAEVAQLVVAYEPVWAIGTGEIATPDLVEPVVAAIRHAVGELYGDEAAAALTVLFGGSVNPDNAKAYLDIPGVNGLLVGGASLKPDEFARIVATAHK